ncbi:MAG: ParB/RepB/Spo0J family partition protein [Phycisphaerales bacterium]
MPNQTNSSSTRSKRRLGRGLSSLIGQPVPVQAPESDAPTSSSAPDAKPSRTLAKSTAPVSDDGGGAALRSLPVESIRANPFQPRKDFDGERLAALAASIRRDGVMQPILVRPDATTSGRYELIAGERRWRAAQLAGLEVVPAVVHDLEDQQTAEWAIVENLQREDLDPVERAEAFQALVDRFDLTQSQIAERVGQDRSSVANILRINNLDSRTKDDLRAERLTVGHAKVLLGVEDAVERRKLADGAIRGGWSVRELERRLDAQRGQGEAEAKAGGAARGAGPKPAHVVELEEKISESLGAPARLELSRKKKSAGRLVVSFANLEEFDALMKKLSVETT